MMECPKCKFEQPSSDVCIDCGVIFAKYKIAQERKKTEIKDTRTYRPSAQPIRGSDNGITFYVVGVLFILILFLRSIYFLEFPPFLDPFFRVLMLLVMGWLGYRIAPKMARVFNKVEGGSQVKRGLDGFDLHDKKAIGLFFAMGSVMVCLLGWSLLSGSVECFSGRNRTCHEVYDSVADVGEFWITILLYYFITLFTISVGYWGVQMRRDRD